MNDTIMHEAARKISFPVERKNETQSKNTMDITGVTKEKVWIELRKATKRAPHKAARYMRAIYPWLSFLFPLIRIIANNITRLSMYVAAQSTI